MWSMLFCIAKSADISRLEIWIEKHHSIDTRKVLVKLHNWQQEFVNDINVISDIQRSEAESCIIVLRK